MAEWLQLSRASTSGPRRCARVKAEYSQADGSVAGDGSIGWSLFLRVPGSPDDKSRSAGRMLCLMPLSDGLPFEEISSVCAATIAKETAEPVLCVKLKVCSTPASTTIPVPAADVGNVFVQRAYGPGDDAFLRALTGVLDRAKSRFAHVIVEAPQDLAIETLIEIIARSCSVYPILRQDEESLFELNLLCREADARGHRGVAIKPLVYSGAPREGSRVERLYRGDAPTPSSQLPAERRCDSICR